MLLPCQLDVISALQEPRLFGKHLRIPPHFALGLARPSIMSHSRLSPNPQPPTRFLHPQEPRLFGEHLELHPIIILLSLAFWSVLWGVSGMILSVPLIAIARIVCQHLDHPYARSVIRSQTSTT